MEKRLSKKTKFAYAIGTFGYSTVCQSMSNFIMFFGTAIMGLSGFLVGVCIALSSVWDAITDPIVGYLSDRSVSRGKKRQNFLIVSCLLTTMFTLLVWFMPNFDSEIMSFVWLFIMLIAYETAETFYSTPYSALGFELSTDKNENTSLQNYKSIFSIIGTITPTVLLIIFTSKADFSLSNASKESFGYIGIVNGILFIISALITRIFVKSQKREPAKSQSKAKTNVLKQFFSIFKDKKCKCIIVGYCASMLATTLLTSIGLHVFTYTFHYNSLQIGILMSCLLFGSIISQPFVYKCSKKIGKLPALVKFLFIIVFSVLFMLLIFYLKSILIKSIVYLLLAILMGLCGFGSGALYSLPSSLFCDIIQCQNSQLNENNTATMSGAMSFAFKITNSLSLFGVGIVLDIIKFNSLSPVQPQFVQNSLANVLLFGILLSLCFAISIFKKST